MDNEREPVGSSTVVVVVKIPLAAVGSSRLVAPPDSLFFLYLRDRRKRSLNDGILL